MPVGPLNACLVSLVVLVVSLAWWLVIVVCWAAAASLLQFFSSHVTTSGLIQVATIQGAAEGYHLVFKAYQWAQHLGLLHHLILLLAFEEETCTNIGRHQVTTMAHHQILGDLIFYLKNTSRALPSLSE